MSLMLANLWKAAPAADSRGVLRFQQGAVGDCGGKKRDPTGTGRRVFS